MADYIFKVIVFAYHVHNVQICINTDSNEKLN